MRYRKHEAKEYAREHLVGIWGAATTPFFPDGSLDEQTCRGHLRHWIDVLHLDGIFITGLMGEFWSLTVAERKRIYEITVEECQDDMHSLPSVCDLNRYDALELVKYAQELDAHFVIVMQPRFYDPLKPSDKEVYDYFAFLANQVDIAVLIFNQSMIQGYAMSPEVISQLAELPNIVGIKNAVRDESHTAEVRRLCGDKILVSNPGEAAWLENHVKHGQRALVSTAPVYLYQTRDWQPIREYTALADAGDLEGARRVSESLNPAREAYDSASELLGPQKECSLRKYWQDLVGQRTGCSVRPPQRELTEEDKAAVQGLFQTSGLAKPTVGAGR